MVKISEFWFCAFNLDLRENIRNFDIYKNCQKKSKTCSVCSAMFDLLVFCIGRIFLWRFVFVISILNPTQIKGLSSKLSLCDFRTSELVKNGNFVKEEKNGKNIPCKPNKVCVIFYIDFRLYYPDAWLSIPLVRKICPWYQNVSIHLFSLYRSKTVN